MHDNVRHGGRFATDLDLERVGALLVGAVYSAALLNHSHPSNTARFYLHPRTREEQFVVDVLSRVPTSVLMGQLFDEDAA